MSKKEPQQAMSSAVNEYSTNWTIWNSKVLLSNDIRAFGTKGTNFDCNNSLEKSECKKQSTAKLGNVIPEKPPNSAPYQNQGLFFSYQAKNDLNSRTSAVHETFQPNVNSNNHSLDDHRISYNKQTDTSRNLQKNVPQSMNKETMPKGLNWNDNFEANSLKVNESSTGNTKNFKLYNTNEKVPQQIHENRTTYMNEQYKRKIPFVSNKNQTNTRFSQGPNHHTFKSSIIKESTKKTNNPSVTTLSQVTTLRVVTPESDVETRKTVKKSWTTNTSEKLSTNETKSGDVLFEHITRKSEKKKMIWLDDLCTVELNNNNDDNNLDYVYRPSKEHPNSKLPNKAPRPRRKRNFRARKPHFKRNEDVQSEVQTSRNTFSDHADEFIRGQYRFESERGRQKVERINVPNRHARSADLVVKHTVEVVHVNQSTRRNGLGRRLNHLNFHPGDESKSSSDGCEAETSSENSYLADAAVGQTAVKKVQPNETPDISDNKIKLNQYSLNDRFYYPTANKSKVNCAVERECGWNLQSNCAGVAVSGSSVKYKTRYESHESSPKVLNREELQRQKSVLIHFGEEISDSIVGCYTAMNMFLSFYNEWKNMRIKAIQLLENISDKISKTTNQRSKTKNVIEMIGNGGKIISAFPDVRTVMIGRIVTALSDFFAKLFGSSPTLKQSGMNEFELVLCLQQDIDATSDMNIYGIQCDQNFQETCAIIEDFHNAIQGWCFEDIAQGLEAEFLKDISTMNPKHHVVYYRRMYTWLRRLAERPSTDLSRAFTRGFKDFPDAVDTTNLLHWRFHVQGIDQTVSLRSWEEIRGLLQNGDSVKIEDILSKIQNSTLVLIKERSVVEKDVMQLLDTEGTLCLEKLKIL
ncbi:hypothetical protein JTE90_017530 [Oedothorax gibbosus]|uniref:Uncharacterized protein n=1 Tax=Oedothorax gibbosus TaxID=931172 RepID=A0AAV6UB64_9ARAC|nr:hypothetical protein JTE90_017530 [Oedothorax gibbosus]